MMHKFELRRRLAIGLAACAALLVALPAAAQAPTQADGAYPPWQGGQNNDAIDKGFEFLVPPVDDLADFHGNPANPALSLYVGGNYFFAMAPLVRAFEAQYPEYRGKLYWETVPPGLLVKQIEAGGTVTVGNMTWTVKPDLYFAGLASVNKQIAAGLLTGPAVPYVTNVLAIMVPKGNPAHITGLNDLGKPDVRIAMPNPAFEGISRQIKLTLAKAGGDQLVQSVYATKVGDHSTKLTHIHHRQTPLWLMQGKVQAGVTWQSEAIFQEKAGNPIDAVAIPEAQNTTAIYAGAMVKGAPHPQAAHRWLDFIGSPAALKIFETYGFKPYQPSIKP